MSYTFERLIYWSPSILALVGLLQLLFNSDTRKISLALLLTIILPFLGYFAAGYFVPKLGHARNFTFLLPIYFLGIFALITSLRWELRMCVVVLLLNSQFQALQLSASTLQRRVAMNEVIEAAKITAQPLCGGIIARDNDATVFRVYLRVDKDLPYSLKTFKSEEINGLINWMKDIAPKCKGEFMLYDFESKIPEKTIFSIGCKFENVYKSPGRIWALEISGQSNIMYQFRSYRCTI